MKRNLSIIGTAIAMSMLLHGCMHDTPNTTKENNNGVREEVLATDTAAGEDTLSQLPEGLADVRRPDMKVRIRKGSALLLETEGFQLSAVDTAVRHAGVYSVTSLLEEDLEPLPQGMKNMTASAAGYRLLPGGEHFSPYAEVRVAYDPARLPEGYTADDIYTSYYDGATQSWVRLERLEVDTVNREIVSATTHFTDFINELLKSPEMPETQAFVPTQMSGLEAANPLAGYSTIAPPVANNMGTANLTYPIQVPAGRGGMQPNLALTYNSNGGNGLCGMGWDLQIPCISVETRWGVPLYDPQKETETYLLNGEQLLVDHDSLPTFARRYDSRDANGTKRFYPRVEGAFDSILRHGTSPQDYWWEVYDRSGTRYIYGHGDGELRSRRENAIAKWYLTRVTDRNGNTARYHYSTYISGERNTSGTAIYLDNISYTEPPEGLSIDSWYGYSVTFHYDNREDPIISGNYGVKENVCKRLNAIKTWFVKNKKGGHLDSSFIRGYRLLYDYSPTGKSLLSAVVEMSPEEWNNLTINQLTEESILKYHKFNYRKLRTDVFGQPETLSTEIENAESGMALLTASPLGGSKSSNESYNFGLGGGLGCNPAKRTFNIEGNGDFSPKSISEGTTSIIDINGDGYPDLLYKESGKWKCQLYLPQSNLYRSPDSVYVSLPTNGFSKSITKDNYSIGIGGHVGWEYKSSDLGVNVGAQYTHSSSDNTMYFADVNADGKPDIVKDGIVWFNNSYGDTITFGRELILHKAPDMPCEIRYFAIDRSEPLNDSIFKEGHQSQTYISWIDEKGFLHDSSLVTQLKPHNQDTLRRSVVRVWIAPESGFIKITGTAKLDSRFNAARERTNADGVYVSIQHNGTVILGHDLTKEHPEYDMSVSEYRFLATNDKYKVIKGDRIYFRVESLTNDLYDVVDWEPTIVYLDKGKQLLALDSAGRYRYIFSAKNDFMAWKDERFTMPQKGKVHVSAGFHYSEALASPKTITLKIIKADTSGNFISLIDSRNLDSTNTPIGGFVVGGFSHRPSYWELDISLDTTEMIYFLAESSHPIDWTKLSWTPHITSKSFDNGDPFLFTLQDEYGQTHTKNAIDIYISPIFPRETVYINKNVAGVHSVERNAFVWDTSIFGNINHCWGSFVYNSNTMRTPIDEKKIKKNTKYLPQQVENIVNSIEDRYSEPMSPEDLLSDLNEFLPNPDQTDASSLDAVYEPGKMSNRILVGFAGRNYITPTQMGLYNWHAVQATIGDSALLVPVTNKSVAASGMTAVGPVKGTYQHGFGVHASGGLNISDNDLNLNGCVNYSNGKNTLTADFIDLNGDGYPDVMSETEAQYTNPWGGLSKKKGGITPLGKQGIQNTVYHSVSLQGGASYSHYYKIGKSRGTVSVQLRDEGVGISASGNASVASSSDHTELIWMDFNGDGLPDCLDDENNVAVNLGYGFHYDSDQWTSYAPSKNTSDCYNISASLGLSGSTTFILNNKVLTTVNHSFTANKSGGKSINTGRVAYVDMNGDGLVDKLVDGNKLFYNRGWGYSNSYKQILNENAESKDVSNSFGYSGSITLGAPIVVPLIGCLKIQNNDGMNTNNSASTSQSMLLDMNADGLPDIVTRAGDGTSISVRYNKLYDVDKLVSVQSFYGNRMDISYAQAPYSPGARQRPTVMQKLTVSDMTGKSGDRRMHRFGYDGYVHSIEERTAYGFENVIDTQLLNNTAYRITRQHYRTDLYKMRGRKDSEILTDANGNRYVENVWAYQLKLISNGNVVPVNMAHCYGATWPALDIVYTRHYNPQTGNVEIETAEQYIHTDSGRVAEYINYNNNATTDDDVHCIVIYSRNSHNQSALPVDMVVTNNAGELLRKRSARYDGIGRLVTLLLYTDEYDLATESNYTYDNYGNILTVKLPPNKNGDRTMFEYSYDSLVHMFRTRTVDVAFRDTSRAEYDVRLGVPIRIYSKGGDSISYTYDGWGRPRTIRAPQEWDTNNYPTIRYLYWDDHSSRALLISRPNFRSFTGVNVLNGLLTEPECDRYSGWPIWAQTLHRSQVDQNLNMTTILFADGHGRVAQTKKTAVINGNLKKVVSGHIDYDDAGRPTKAYEPFDTTESYCDYTKPQTEGMVTLTSYDILDRVVESKIQISSRDNIVTRNTYGFSRVGGVCCFSTKTTDPEGRQSITMTDARGLTMSSIDALQGETRFEYDALGQLSRTYDPDNFKTEYGYDKLGHLSYRIHPDAYETNYTYDPAGNLTKEVNPLGEINYDYTYYRLMAKRYEYMAENNVTYKYGTVGSATGLPVHIVDGSGELTLDYDAMGNVSKSVRVLSVPAAACAYTFTHTFFYDSWGRMDTMTYPDGEKVTYHYNHAGDLRKMEGEKDGFPHLYINSISYNKYGQRTYIEYGNRSFTKYEYDSLQRLCYLESRDGNQPHQKMQQITYKFDKVGNITGLINDAPSNNGLGGTYLNTYEYDNLNRLIEAHGTGNVGGRTRKFNINTMQYSGSGMLGLKVQNWTSVTTNGDQIMRYGYLGDNPDYQPHAPRFIEDHAFNNMYNLEWDKAGNLIQVSAQGEHPAFSTRFLYWTEDNRLHTVADDRHYSYYAYDHTGQRTLKMTGDAYLLDQNAWCQHVGSALDHVTIYPSAYLVLSEHGYTKHYYAGADRVAARIGGGNLNHDIECIVNDSEAIDRATSLFWRCYNHVNSSKVWHQDLKKMKIVDINGDELKMIWDFEMNQVPSTQNAEIKPDPAGINKVIKHFSRPASQADPNLGDEPEVYFYHSDHLGSASWITDADGKPIQHLQYLPFGEPFVNQHLTDYQERYLFTGKERDEETGYGYFGARYMDHELMTMFISVDRYASKYPFISPYVYCAWNPIRITDPNGDSLRLDGTPEQRETVLNYLHQTYGNLTFQCDENGYVTLDEELSTIGTYSDRYIKDMTTSSDVSVIDLLEDGEAEKRGIIMQPGNPTRFGGTSDLQRDNNGNIIRVEGTQYLNIDMLGRICGNDDKSIKYPGRIIMHEFSEGFEGCKLARRFKRPLTDKDYSLAHIKANEHFFANFIPGTNNKIKLDSQYLR